MRLTGEEKAAIAALKRLEKTWPKSLWLYSASGTLCVMKKVNGEQKMNRFGGVDQERLIDSIKIENGGGDW